jgi:predicted RNase H-like HicB family nuclease
VLPSCTAGALWLEVAYSEGSPLPGYDRIQGKREEHMRQLKIVVEKHLDGYVAYPIGLNGVVVGQGDSYEDALADVKSAIRFHIETFGEN